MCEEEYEEEYEEECRRQPRRPSNAAAPRARAPLRGCADCLLPWHYGRRKSGGSSPLADVLILLLFLLMRLSPFTPPADSVRGLTHFTHPMLLRFEYSAGSVRGVRLH